MPKGLDRRGFLGKSVAASAGAALGFGFEDKALLAQAAASAEPTGNEAVGPLPAGKIGEVTISRLICGGNLISSFAHSRDLIYVSPLIKNYFTDDKIMETFELCEENGVNTAILRLDLHCRRILNKYWHERGGQIQWIAQVKPKRNDLFTDIEIAVDNGAIGVYIQGEVGDSFTESEQVDLLGEALEHIKECGVIAGMGAHAIKVPIACEKAGLDPDFYMKTFNSKSYWSAGPEPRHDSVWAETPEQTIEFMGKVKKPWIAFKVLGAGAIHPRDGFKYAFDNGADFLCVGMFDFQVKDDIAIASKLLAEQANRPRPWMA